MRFDQHKIRLISLVFIMGLAPQACLVEMAISAIADGVSHHAGGNEQHQHTTPSHKHDEQGQEASYCCDNSLSSFVVSQPYAPPLPSTFYTRFVVNQQLAVPESLLPSASLRYLSKANPPGDSFRTRDKYALSSLLHAPPPA